MKVEQHLLVTTNQVDRVLQNQTKPFRQIQGREVEVPLSHGDEYGDEGAMVIFEEEDEESKRGYVWERCWAGHLKPEDRSESASSRGGSSRYLLHNESRTSCRTSCSSTNGTESQSGRGLGGLGGCGSALLVHAQSGASCSSSSGPSVPRISTGSLTDVVRRSVYDMPSGGLDSCDSTYFESGGASCVTDCSSPRSSRVIGRGPNSARFCPWECSSEFGSSTTLGVDDLLADDAEARQTTTARERSRLRRLTRWVGKRVHISPLDADAYARVLEENGFDGRAKLCDLTNARAEELGLPRRFANILRREALLGLPAERKFGPLPPAPEVPEEDESPTPREDPVEVCIMYDTSGEKKKPSTIHSYGFPSQLRAYPPSEPGTPRQSTGCSTGSRNSLALRAHLERQENGRRAQSAGLSRDAWFASSFNHRSNSVAMPKARARSVAGFERPQSCVERVGAGSRDIAPTIPDKDAAQDSHRKGTPKPRERQSQTSSSKTVTPEATDREEIVTPPSPRQVINCSEPRSSSSDSRPQQTGAATRRQPVSKEDIWEEVRRHVSDCSRLSPMVVSQELNDKIRQATPGSANGKAIHVATPRNGTRKDVIVKTLAAASPAEGARAPMALSWTGSQPTPAIRLSSQNTPAPSTPQMLARTVAAQGVTSQFGRPASARTPPMAQPSSARTPPPSQASSARTPPVPREGFRPTMVQASAPSGQAAVPLAQAAVPLAQAATLLAGSLSLPPRELAPRIPVQVLQSEPNLSGGPRAFMEASFARARTPNLIR